MADRVYRLLLLLFPARTRREFGGDMLRLFRDQLADARAQRRSVAALWLHALSDAFVHGLGERTARCRPVVMNIARAPRRWRWWMYAFLRDLRHAGRMLLRQPGLTIPAIVTLALGIGANTAIFSAVDAVLLRPLPYDDPDRLVMVWEKREAEHVLDNVVSPADYLDWARMNTSFESIAAMTPLTADLTGAGDPIRLYAGAVSAPFFDVFRTRPALGRSFRRDEEVAGRHRVVILSHGLWTSRFGSDPSIVGRSIPLNGIPHEVVGVLPARFASPDPEIEIWAPLVLEGGSEPPSRTSHFLSVYARLRPGVGVEQARAEMDRIGADLARQYPEANRSHSAWVNPLENELTQPLRGGLLLLFGAVAFVLLIACVNVANLLLVRAVSRRREMAVRAALGAGRARLAGQAITESLAVGAAGGAAGLLVARWGIDLLRTVAPSGVFVSGSTLGLDARVLGFAFALSMLTAVLFGLLPAWHIARQNTNDGLKEGGRSPAGIRRGLRLALVVSEIALATLLLAGAGLAIRSFETLMRAEPGFTTEGILTTFVTLPASRYRGDERIVSGFDAIERRLASIPGVRAIGATSDLPLTGMGSRRGVIIEGYVPEPDTPTRTHPRSITPGYLKAMGIQLVAGRPFSSSDRADTPPVVLVNETMAGRYWRGQRAVGQRMKFTGETEWREVVGVFRDVRHWGLDQPVNPEMYLPLPQWPSSGMTFVLASDLEPGALTSAAREALKDVDPQLAMSDVRTMEDVAARSVASQRALMLLLGSFAGLALVLAAAGIYGVMAHLVTLRTAEIGVRLTLGAAPADVMRLVIREGLLQAAAGLTLGLSAALVLARFFRALLYGISPADPFTLTAVVLLLLATALVACLVPARRAMKVDPVAALR